MMQTFFNPLGVNLLVWLGTFSCAFINGLSKGGLKGLGMVTVPLMVFMYGGMASTGLLLPILIFSDFMAFRVYRKSAQWHQVKKLLPWVLPGLLIAVAVGKFIHDGTFRDIIAILIIVSLGIILVFDFFGKKVNLSQSPTLSAFTGLLGGFASMIGNAAGPLFNLYLLSTRIPKNSFIATGAIFYGTMNLIKVPFHVFAWHSITWNSFHMNLLMIPAVIAGVYTGKKIASYIPEKAFRMLVLTIIALSALLLLIK